MSGSHYRKLLADSPTKQGVSSNTSADESVMASRTRGNKFASALPGIGLHLNALAAVSKNKIIVKSQTLTCRRKLKSSPCTKSSLSDTRPTVKLESEVFERESDEHNDGVHVSRNVSETSTFGDGVELPQNSPKKKRCLLLVFYCNVCYLLFLWSSNFYHNISVWFPYSRFGSFSPHLCTSFLKMSW